MYHLTYEFTYNLILIPIPVIMRGQRLITVPHLKP